LSGSGNVAIFCTEKLLQLGGKVVTLSDSDGYVYDPEGIDIEKLAWIKELKLARRGRIAEYAQQFNCEYHSGKPWRVPCDLAFPCATQNELDVEDARALVGNGCMAVSEGANMPTTVDAVGILQQANVLYGPGKAANAGGVSVSGLEMSQNSLRMAWSAKELEQRLQQIVTDIHRQCVHHGQEGAKVNYVKGANLAGFIKVADAMLAYGVI
jgi:glutamate dehydrogenase (NADP+)